MGAFFLLSALPAVAAPWLPATELSESGYNSDGEVEFDGAGNAVAVFRHSDGTEYVQAAEKAAGGTWQAPLNLSSSPYPPESPQIAIDAAGDAVVVWGQYGGSRQVVRAAVRSAGGAWQAPVTISDPSVNSQRAEVAVDSSGAAAVVWEVPIGQRFEPGGSFVQSAAMSAAGVWQAPVTLSLPGEQESDPAVVFDSAGAAIAVWQSYNAGSGVIESAEMTSEGAGWGPPEQLSAPGVNAIEARISSDAQGGLVAIWARYNGNWVIQGASREAGGTWTPAADISDPNRTSLSPQLAVDARGHAIAVWQTHVAQYVWMVQGAAGLGNVWEAPADLSTADEIGEPQVASDPAGDAVVSWIINNQNPQVATKTANGSWQPPIYVPRYTGSHAKVAVDSDGYAIVISQHVSFSGPESGVQATEHRAIRLSVGRTGSGSGTVSSAPSGIDCGPVCAAQFEDDSTATLTAAAAAGSTFTGWSGACAGTGPCTAAMTESRSVSANFDGDEAPRPDPLPSLPDPPAPPADEACPAVGARAGTFVPVAAAGRAIAGVRARVGVGTPSQLRIEPRLTYARNGTAHRVQLIPLGVHIATARNLRMSLPPSALGALPLGTKVELTLRISATADSAPGCSSAAVSVRHFSVRVVRVLATGQPGIS